MPHALPDSSSADPAAIAPSVANGALLSLDTVSKQLGDRAVLREVSLSVNAGELVVLLGPNGAGKTTLLGAACGRVAPDGGKVRVEGEDPRRQPDAREALGFVPQTLAVYPYLSVRENLEVLGRLMGVRRRALSARVADSLRWSGLTERAEDRVDTLSGGMQRRLNIVASLLHEPRLLLLDEPTVGVDVTARERIHDLLGELRSRGLGILLTTHDLEQATTLADRVVFLLDGHVRLEGAPQALIEHVFGDGRELTILLTEPAATKACDLLSQAGLTASADRRAWTGAVASGYDAVAEWTARLPELGLAAREIRVREPGLEGVFLRLTGEELGL